VTRFESQLLSHVRSEHPQVLASIRDTGALSDDTTASLKELIGNFAKSFA
jgi:F-type H+-transporting ATPase subunit alpha